MLVYLDFLPDELVYVIYSCSDPNTDLKNLSARYKDIYDKFLN